MLGDYRFESYLDEQLYLALYEAGFRPIPQYKVGQYSVDFAITSDEQKLAIEIDGQQFMDHKISQRNYIRDQKIKELGWDVMHFYVEQIHNNMPSCIEKIHKKWGRKESRRCQ